MVSEGTMKDWVFELVCTGAAGRIDEAVAWANRAARGWAALPKLATLDLYAPVTGGAHDPFNDDGPGPLFIAMLAFPSREALAAAVASPELTSSLGGRPGSLHRGRRATSPDRACRNGRPGAPTRARPVPPRRR